ATVVEKAPQKGMWWTVKGWGTNQQEAEEDAARHASKTLAAFLKAQQPPLTAAPPPAYVRKHLIRGPAQRKADEDQVVDQGPEHIPMECGTVTLAVTPQNYADLVRLQREFRQQRYRSERMLLLARITGAALALLAGVVGLVRLRDWAGNSLARRVN